MEWLLAALGLVILVFAGDALVKGAVNIALRLKIPAIIIGLTIVAFGTSAPELLVSVNAALDGVAGIALGNVVGSNIANILLVLGLPALIAPMMTSECSSRRSFFQLIGATALFMGLAYTGSFHSWTSLALLLALSLILFSQFREVLSHREMLASEELPEGAEPGMALWKIIGYLVVGLIGLPLGADLLVDNAVIIAQDFGVSETVIGLTLVAIGTSLPELATTVMAVLRRQADVGMGNVIGSCIFNLLFIIGVAGLIAPIPVDPQLLALDLWVMLGATALLIPFVLFGQNVTRLWGMGMLALYGAYMTVLFV